MRIDISEVVREFPSFRVGVIVAEGLQIAPARPDWLDTEIEAIRSAAHARWAGKELADIPGIAVWRAAYRQFGIKKTSYRCSVERLVKNCLAGRPLPSINAFVDGYNAVSLAHVMPAGADDLDKVTGDLFFRRARDGDTFFALGQEPPENDPPKPGEVVYADGEKVLCRRWNWYQDARSPVTVETKRAVVTIQFNGEGDLLAAIADARRLVELACAGRTASTIASAAAPVAELATP